MSTKDAIAAREARLQLGDLEAVGKWGTLGTLKQRKTFLAKKALKK